MKLAGLCCVSVCFVVYTPFVGVLSFCFGVWASSRVWFLLLSSMAHLQEILLLRLVSALSFLAVSSPEEQLDQPLRGVYS